MPEERKKKKKLPSRKVKGAKEIDTYHHGDLRGTLIDAALKILETGSSDSLSLRELARLVGVSQSAPYRHFKNKEELLAAISQQGFELQFNYMREAVRTYRNQPTELFFQCAISYFRMGLSHRQHYRLMFSGGVTPSPECKELHQAASSTFILLRDVIRICQKAGVLGAGDAYHRAFHCWSVVNGFTSLYVEGRLSWLGVTEDNAIAALRTLMGQYLRGAQGDLDLSQEGMTLFQGELPASYLADMEMIRFED